MNDSTRNSGDYGFIMGLFAGTVVGAGLMMWLVPKATSELRQRVTTSATALGERATALGERASEKYQQTTAQLDEQFSELTRKGQGIRDDVAEVVVRGAQKVERFAAAAKTAPASREL